MRPGDIIADRFEIGGLADEGGMGSVFRGTDRETGKPVAVKHLHSRGAVEAGRLAQEARVLRELDHPLIVRYVAHGTTANNHAFLAMEWLDGEDLGERLARSPLTVAESLRMASALAAALGYAHDRGIIHRDVKPSNVFLLGGKIEMIKLVDFGIARIGAAPVAFTRTGMVVGTPGYMAPEQVRGDTDVDVRCDVFALGCVLFECLTGKPAYTGESPLALLAKILLEDPPRVTEYVDVPPEIDEAVARLMGKERETRPANGRAALRVLEMLPTFETGLRPSPSVRPQGITRGEQKLVAIVLARPEGSRPAAFGAPAVTLDGPSPSHDFEIGARIDRLADGTLVSLLESSGSATDLAMRAARVALALRSRMPDAPISLSMGRAATSARLPVGEAVERAARMLDEPATLSVGVPTSAPLPVVLPIRIDEVTAALLDARFYVGGDRHSLVLRGEREAVDTARKLLGRPSPFVGRARELRAIEGLMEESASEPIARAVLVTGAPGVGKSRLRFELLRRAAELPEPPELWIAFGDPISAGSSLGLVRQMLRRALGLTLGEEPNVDLRKIEARVARLVEKVDDQRRVAEFLGELVGVHFPDADSEPLRVARRDPVAMSDQLRRAFGDFAAAQLDAGPLLVVVEDLHWGDAGSVTFLDALLRQQRDKPLMVLAFARPQVTALFPDLWKGRGLAHIELAELSRKACERLVRDTLGSQMSDDAVARLVDHSAGNAFYLEELIRGAAAGQTDALPATVTAMVQARLEALDADSRRLLRGASVFGEAFWDGALASLVGAASDPTEIRNRLRDLEERELIVSRPISRFPGNVEYGFRHGVVREVAYGMLTDDDRELAHRLAARWLEKAGEHDAVAIAEHYESGGEALRAVPFWERAAHAALLSNELSVAIERAGRGLACGVEGELRGHLKLLQSEAHRWRGGHERALQLAEEAARDLEEGSTSWGEAVDTVVMVSTRLGARERFLSWAEHLERALSQDHPTLHVLTASAQAGRDAYLLGESAIAERLRERVALVAKARDIQDGGLLGRMLEAEATVAQYRGDTANFVETHRRAAEVFERAGLERNALITRTNIASGLCALGLYEEAAESTRLAAVVAERMGLDGILAFARQNMGFALARLGRLAEAHEVENLAVKSFVEQANRRMEGGSRVYLGMILMEMGRLDEAETEARLAVELTQPYQGMQPLALASLADILRRKLNVSEGLVFAKLATTLHEAHGTEEGELFARLVHAELLYASGEQAAALEALRVSHERLFERAQRIAREDWRTSFLARVPEHSRIIELARRLLQTA
ncbi:MAG: protein kinase [Polyangiaceae bacterium]